MQKLWSTKLFFSFRYHTMVLKQPCCCKLKLTLFRSDCGRLSKEEWWLILLKNKITKSTMCNASATTARSFLAVDAPNFAFQVRCPGLKEWLTWGPYQRTSVWSVRTPVKLRRSAKRRRSVVDNKKGKLTCLNSLLSIISGDWSNSRFASSSWKPFFSSMALTSSMPLFVKTRCQQSKEKEEKKSFEKKELPCTNHHHVKILGEQKQVPRHNEGHVHVREDLLQLQEAFAHVLHV